MHRLSVFLLLLVVATGGIPAALAADEQTDEQTDEQAAEQSDEELLPEGTQRCVNTARIRNTRIVDDSTILFYMLGGDIYVNRLPRRCPGLRVADTFSYKTSTNSLCDVDIITVIRPGMGVVRGPSCGLGKFRPISAEEARFLLTGPEPEAEDEKVVPEIQTPEGGEGEAEADEETEAAD